jgi:hypothetical protein
MPPKSTTTSSPASARRPVGRACGRALFGPDATIVSKAGFSNPARFTRQSMSAAISSSVRPARTTDVQDVHGDRRQQPAGLPQRLDLARVLHQTAAARPLVHAGRAPPGAGRGEQLTPLRARRTLTCASSNPTRAQPSAATSSASRRS